jgi:hypothetical protein
VSWFENGHLGGGSRGGTRDSSGNCCSARDAAAIRQAVKRWVSADSVARRQLFAGGCGSSGSAAAAVAC